MAQAVKQDLAARHAGRMKPATEPAATHQLAPDQIRINGGTQMRAGLNMETVEEYAAAMTEYSGWGTFKPVEVYHDGATYWLADGFHRVAAAQRAGVSSIPALVHAGDQRKAILHAAGANAEHGLRRTNADKRRAVETLLRDEEWRQMSDREIADKCKVDQKTVNNIRRELTATKEIPKSTMRMGRDGRTIDTANIGRKAERKPPAPVWALEAEVKVWLKSVATDTSTPDAGTVLDMVKMQLGETQPVEHSWLSMLCQAMQDGGIVWRKSDLEQAVNNVIEQRRQAKRQAELRGAARAVYVDPKPESVASITNLVTPPDLAAAGYEIVMAAHNNSWRWVDANGEVGDTWSWADAVADARKRIELTSPPASAWEQKFAADMDAYDAAAQAEADDTPIIIPPSEQDRHEAIVELLISPTIDITTTLPMSLHWAIGQATDADLLEAHKRLPDTLRTGRGPVLEVALKKRGIALPESKPVERPAALTLTLQRVIVEKLHAALLVHALRQHLSAEEQAALKHALERALG